MRDDIVMWRFSFVIDIDSMHVCDNNRFIAGAVWIATFCIFARTSCGGKSLIVVAGRHRSARLSHLMILGRPRPLPAL